MQCQRLRVFYFFRRIFRKSAVLNPDGEGRSEQTGTFRHFRLLYLIGSVGKSCECEMAAAVGYGCVFTAVIRTVPVKKVRCTVCMQKPEDGTGNRRAAAICLGKCGRAGVDRSFVCESADKSGRGGCVRDVIDKRSLCRCTFPDFGIVCEREFSAGIFGKRLL